ncbi:MAG: phosphatase PAP2 family protein, partial [Acidimicrobiales bacterium]
MRGAHRRPRARRLRWWREVLHILAFYSVYSFIRNKGAATDSSVEAFRNARQVIRAERALGSFHEEAIQDAFLGSDWFIRFWNIFYGTAHFIVTVVALVYLFRRMSGRYPLWRNTLAFTTGMALVGFAFYPLMPPRLLPAGYGFVDTLKDVGGLWSFESGAVAKISNQYAAMPSLHFAWSSWCAFVLVPALRRPWQKAAMILYPFLTLFAIVVTANHYWLDAAGGAVTLAVGFVLGRAFTKFLADRVQQPVPETAPAGVVIEPGPEPEKVLVGADRDGAGGAGPADEAPASVAEP